MREFLHSFEVEKCRKYIFYLKDSDTLDIDGVNPCESKTYGANHYYFERFLQSKLQTIQDCLSFEVKPRKSLGRIYFNGGNLKNQVDRESLDVTAIISLGGTIDDEWPISFTDLHGKTHCVQIEKGDALVFLGNKMPHWRDTLECREDQNTLKLFLHWRKTNEMEK